MDLEFFAVGVVAMAIFASTGWLRWRRPAAAARLTRDFARRVDLGMDDAVEATVTARLTRRERAGGAGGLILGVAAAATVAGATDPTPRDAYRFFAVFLGYAAGHAIGHGVVAWRESARRPADGPRLARATMPTYGDYVARHERVGSWVAAGIAVVLGAAFLLAGRGDVLDGAVPVALAVAAVVVPPVTVVVDELLARRLLDRPQVATSQTELAWDDALRARTLRDMVGVPLMTGYFAAVALLGEPAVGREGGGSVNTLRGGLNVPFLVLLGGGLVMAVVSARLGPEQHFRRRLWPDVPRTPRGLELHADAAQGAQR